MRSLIRAASLAIAFSISTGADAVELRLGMAPPASTPWGHIAEKFAAKVAELSDGDVNISIYYNSELGDEQTMARQVPRGRLDMALLSNVAASLIVPEYGLLLLPYLFENAEQADCVMDHYLGDSFDARFLSAGAVLLHSIEVGRMVLMSKTPLWSPADMVGHKVRTSPAATDTFYIQATGATAIPISSLESMPALRSGTVVAVTTPIVMGVAAGYSAEASQITLTEHGRQIGAVLISKKTWDSLDDQERSAISQAAEVLAELRHSIRVSEAELLEEAKAEGATVHIPDEHELAAWKSVAKLAEGRIIADLGGDANSIWADLQAAKSACVL